MTPDLGINSESIQYEVALEVLGQDFQPLMRAIALENEKPNPSIACLNYLNARLNALKELQSDLMANDKDIIESILDKTNHIYRL
jgi:hypothetical protein